MICNILDNITELYMIKYTIGETFSSGRIILSNNPSDLTVLAIFKFVHRKMKTAFNLDQLHGNFKPFFDCNLIFRDVVWLLSWLLLTNLA